ncbi:MULTISPECIES: WecB/TagA/CpsF family glycosyltransferase [Sphingobium]|uniref:N-acetylmannosaminyltransferase n=2 Tax=Sphingobium TaxID=165695 RepID=A0A292ZL94_SPHSA|nr:MULTISPECIES: WecB/TagA/CpsF family glycosyltransferase [Sphingobium]GAY23643.1 N-acetylmannosaminyltransferase [Sphingobium fuliginis]
MKRGTGMKIVHISRQYHPGIGGLENFTRNLCEEQARAGHDVRMVTLNRIFDGDGAELPARETIGGVEVVRLPFRGGRRYPIAPAVLRHVRDCDLIHVHAMDFFVDFLALTRFLHQKPMVLSTHGGFFHTDYAQRLKQVYFHSISRLSLSRFHATIACSEADQDSFARICRQRLTLVENGVDIDKFAAAADPDARAILYFGRIAPNKRIDRLIRWFAALNALDPAWSLIVAGKPMGVALSDLRRIAVEQGVSQKVEFHDSPSDEALRALIGRSSIFASASAYEGFGISLIEAVSAGLYPAASDIPAHRRSCEKLGVGTLLHFDDPLSAARLLKDFRTARVRGALKDAAEPLRGYSWPEVSARIVHIYDQILGHRQRAIGPVKVAVLSQTEALAEIRSHVRAQRPKVIAFCNAHMANLARKDDRLAGALSNALVLNDGIGVDLASRLRYGRSFPVNLNGTDFIPALLKDHPEGLRLFLVGAAPGVAERAAVTLRRLCPRLSIVGMQHGFFDPQEEAGLSDRIGASKADLVLACMGNPRQEIWAARWAPEFGRPVLCGGALLDFLAGRVRRAPAWVQRARFEWAWRLFQEPTRLADRYLRGNLSFIVHALKDAWRGQDWEDTPPPAPTTALRGADAA